MNSKLQEEKKIKTKKSKEPNPSIPKEIYEAFFNTNEATVTEIEKGINPGFVILKK